MIKAKDAISVARSLIGTPYSQLDCINLIKKVIRTAPGGVKGYTTAGTNALWKSYEASAKYKDLTERKDGLGDVPAGALPFKRDGANVHHVGIATGEGTVIHSSSAQGGRGVVETPLTAAEGWNCWGIHRYIKTKSETEEAPMSEYLFKAKVDTVSGPLNMRELPAKNSMIVELIQKGEVVEVIEKNNLEWWRVRYKGETGYCAEEYLSRIVEEEPEIPAQGEAVLTVQIVIIDEAGNQFRPVGAFTVDIEMLLDGETLEEAESIDWARQRR